MMIELWAQAGVLFVEADRPGFIFSGGPTYRLFNIPEPEDACEDHGQAVVYLYRGSISESPTSLDSDRHHSIEARKVFPVCGNTYRMLQQTRFAPHFEFIGAFDRHEGLFDGCGSAIPFDCTAAAHTSVVASCC